MRAMLTLVVVMGVLIVAGVVTLAVTIMHRLSGGGTPVAGLAAMIDEPPGTHMQSLSAAGDRLAILLQGGGPDRVVLVDPRTGQVVGRIGLSR